MKLAVLFVLGFVVACSSSVTSDIDCSSAGCGMNPGCGQVCTEVCGCCGCAYGEICGACDASSD